MPTGGSDETAQGATPEDWSFWIKWYDDALAGREPKSAMLEEIALIPPGTWEQGPQVVNPLINDIWDKYRGDDPTDLDAQLSRLPKPSSQIVERVRNSMRRNRKELPPTFDAIESLILLEIERLQNRNFRDDEDQEEAIRQIGVYLSLHTAIEGLRANLPLKGEVTAQKAEATERLWTLYRNKFAALPREKADEVVEGVWDAGVGAVQFGLITGSTYLGQLYGVPVGASATVAAYCFAPKKAGNIIKSAIDLYQTK